MLDLIFITVFLSFPEFVLDLMIGLSLCNIKVSLKKILLVAFIQAFVAFFVWKIHIPFGLHNIIQILICWIIVIIILEIKFYKAIVPVLIGYFLDNIIQGIFVSSVGLIIDLDFSRLGVEFGYTLIYSLCIFIILSIILLIVKKTNFHFCDLSAEGEFIGEQK